MARQYLALCILAAVIIVALASPPGRGVLALFKVLVYRGTVDPG